MSKFIELKNVRKEFLIGENVIKALDDIGFSVAKGEFISITGRSGSGKSTLLNILAGLERPSGGEIIIDDRHIERMGEGERIRFRREKIGFIFQSYNLLPQYTALENVMLPLTLKGIQLKDRTKIAMDIMEQVGVYTHKNHKPSEMSGGQQQRVGIARALVTSPSIVLADELTGNLDTKTSVEVMELLVRLFEDRGTTFLLVSHDKITEKYTQRSISLLDGKIENT